jgi:hypothetical protein
MDWAPMPGPVMRSALFTAPSTGPLRKLARAIQSFTRALAQAGLASATPETLLN